MGDHDRGYFNPKPARASKFQTVRNYPQPPALALPERQDFG
jgi:hypothetical protein